VKEALKSPTSQLRFQLELCERLGKTRKEMLSDMTAMEEQIWRAFTEVKVEEEEELARRREAES
jgi:hypothetical protein